MGGEMSGRRDRDGLPSVRKRRPRSRAALAGLTVSVALGLLATAALGARTVTRAQARAVANAISLRHSDLPSLTQTNNPVTPQQLQVENKAIACAGAVPLSKAFANTQSPLFQSGGTAPV